MVPFNISPTEALLIGCCVGEYLEAKHDNEHANFLHFMLKRLRPFVPSMETSTKTTLVATDPALFGVEWETLSENGEEIGFSEAEPMCVFRKVAGTITMTTWDCSRKSLIDLLYELIEPLVTKSLREVFQMPPPRRDYALKIEAAYQNLLEADFVISDRMGELKGAGLKLLSGYQTPSQRDDHERLVRAIEELIEHNRLRDEYDLGRLFGQLFAELERWNLGVCEQVNPRGYPLDTLITEYRDGRLMWQPITGKDAVDNDGGKCGTNDAEERCRRAVERVRSHKYVRSCPHAEMILLAEPSLSVTSGNPQCTEVSEFCEAKAAASLALGAVLGAMSQADMEAYAKDAASPTPRMFMLGSQASLDRVRGQVHAVELALNDRTRIELRPEDVIAWSENVIEGLAKDLWKGGVSQGNRKSGLWNVLREHCESSNEGERRFARVALTLYDVYRKPAQHDMLAFRCTWSEARFFHIGMRLLVELSDKIKKERTSNQWDRP